MEEIYIKKKSLPSSKIKVKYWKNIKEYKQEFENRSSKIKSINDEVLSVTSNSFY